MIIERRSFLKGVGLLFAAPAIVHAGNIMAVHEIVPSIPSWCPDGWLPLDGRAIRAKLYPDLYEQYKRLRFSMSLDNRPPEANSFGRTAYIVSAKDFVRPNGTVMKAGAGHTVFLPTTSDSI